MHYKKTHSLNRILQTILVSVLALALSITALPAYALEESAQSQSEDLPASSITDEEIAAILDNPDEATATFSENARTASPRSVSTVLAGNTLFDTSAAQVRAAYPNGCTRALVVAEKAWSDALSASSLAGAMNCPIVFTHANALNETTSQLLRELGVKDVICIGGNVAIQESVVSALRSQGIGAQRVSGRTLYDTQMAIYNYGNGSGRNYWQSGSVIVATGASFADALSIAPYAFAKKTPVFLATPPGNLSSTQQTAISEIANQKKAGAVALSVGGPKAISESTRSFLTSKFGTKHFWIWGNSQYDTSSKVAEWCTGDGGMQWDQCAFTTGESPFDALSGSVLQGKRNSILLLVNGVNSPTINTAASNRAHINSVVFFGGNKAMPAATRNVILTTTGLVQNPNAKYINYNLAYSTMLRYQDAVNSATASQIDPYLDPRNYTYDSPSFYQFAKLNSGYSGKLNAAQLNNYIASVVSYQEGNYGVKSKLRGMGQVFIDAARKYNVNEVYLLSHAALESAWGCSRLSQGSVPGYENFYNFYGIGAYDYDPNNAGAAMAKRQGWNTPEKAIYGAAEWISKNYLNNSTHQDTLYKMRWNVEGAVNSHQATHQYATSLTWATGIASVMDRIYRQYGLTCATSGLTFNIPQYR